MVVGRNNGVVELTGFSDKKMSGLLFGPQKSGRIKLGGRMAEFHKNSVYKNLWSQISPASRSSRNPPGHQAQACVRRRSAAPPQATTGNMSVGS